MAPSYGETPNYTSKERLGAVYVLPKVGNYYKYFLCFRSWFMFQSALTSNLLQWNQNKKCLQLCPSFSRGREIICLHTCPQIKERLLFSKADKVKRKRETGDL